MTFSFFCSHPHKTLIKKWQFLRLILIACVFHFKFAKQTDVREQTTSSTSDKNEACRQIPGHISAAVFPRSVIRATKKWRKNASNIFHTKTKNWQN